MGTIKGREDMCMRLYRDGKSDSEIGRRMKVSSNTVADWRARSRLDGHRPELRRLTEAEKAERLSLYNAGMLDKQIAERVGRSPGAIAIWRSSLGLPGRCKRLSNSENASRRAMYDAGMNDREISEAVGCDRGVIQAWRRRHALPTRTPSSQNLSPEQSSARRLLYETGRNDCVIAREQHVTPQAVRYWRKRQGLAPQARQRGRRRAGDPTLDRIRRAIGRALPADLADDAVSDLYLAALEGRVSLDRIEAEARSFGRRVQNNFANRFRSRSVDEAIAGTDDLRLIDTLVEESAEDWLEEMGATVSHLP